MRANSLGSLLTCQVGNSCCWRSLVKEVTPRGCVPVWTYKASKWQLDKPAPVHRHSCPLTVLDPVSTVLQI